MHDPHQPITAPIPIAPTRSRGRTLLVATGLMVAAVAAAVVFLASRIDPADVARLAAQKVKTQTGRELTIDGKVGFSVTWEPTLFAEGVRFQNAEWGSRPDMAHIKRVEVTIALRPLLQGQVDILRVKLVEPDILIETDARGTGNWVLSGPEDQPPPAAGEPRGVSFLVRDAELHAGLLTYRNGRDRHERRLEVASMHAAVTGPFTRVTAAGSGRYEATDFELAATLDRGASPADLGLTLKTKGASLVARTTLGGGAGTPPVQLGVEVVDWATVARLSGAALPSLPALKAEGRLTLGADTLAVEGLKATLGRSSFAGRLRVGYGRPVPHIDADLEAPLLDLAELLGPPPTKDADAPAATATATATGSIFSTQALSIATLKAVDGRLHARVARLLLRDGRAVDRLEIQADAAKGRVVANPIRAHIGGQELHAQARLDGSTGNVLGLELAVKGDAIPFGALATLLKLPEVPQGSTIDIDIRFSGRGQSQRELMAGADADVRLVVGPGRLNNRAVDWGADITELLAGINPAHRADPYTELKCAVVRLPIRHGVVRIDNSVAVETSKVQVLAAGAIDLRNETLDIGLRPKASTGLGIGLGGLASLARLRGSLSQPEVQIDSGAAALATAQLWLASATGGLSLLASGLLSERFPPSACQAALAQAAAPTVPAAPEAAAPSPGLIDNLDSRLGRLLGR